MGKVKSRSVKRQLSTTSRSHPVQRSKNKPVQAIKRDRVLEKKPSVLKVRKNKRISIKPLWRLAEPSYQSKMQSIQLDIMDRTPRRKASFISRMVLKEFNQLMPEDIKLTSKKNIMIWKFLKYKQRMSKQQENVGDENSPDESNAAAAIIPCRRSSVCCACQDNGATLRCPTCLFKYCNLTCYKAHKQLGICQKGVLNEQPQQTAINCGFRKYNYPSKDTVPTESLEGLRIGDKGEKLKQFLKDKMIKDAIRNLNSTTNPVEEFRKVMMREQFVQFSDFILSALKHQ